MTVREKIPLEPALTFLRELWALDHALGSASKRMHDRMGITAEQRMVFRFVGKFPGMTAAELASILQRRKEHALVRIEASREQGPRRPFARHDGCSQVTRHPDERRAKAGPSDGRHSGARRRVCAPSHEARVTSMPSDSSCSASYAFWRRAVRSAVRSGAVLRDAVCSEDQRSESVASVHMQG